MASKLTNAAGLYRYILAQPFSPGFTLPAAAKRAYRSVKAARRYYLPQTDTAIKRYAVAGSKGSADKYAKLFDLYNAQYLQNAVLAARQTREAGEQVTGAGEHYAAAAAALALNEAMAQRSAAVPKLMQAAEYAHARDLADRQAGVKAALEQRESNEDTARAVYDALFDITDKKHQSLQTARKVKTDALDDWYDLQASLEKGSSSSSGRKRSSSKKKSSKKKKSSSKKVSQKEQWSKLTPYEYYQRICYNYPGASGYLMTPAEYARHHKVSSYKSYVDSVLEANGFGLK